MSQVIGVYTGDAGLVSLLREHCPECVFADDPASASVCRVVIVDADRRDVLEQPPPKSIVRLVLLAADPDQPRRSGEIRVARSNFLQAPREFLEVASDLADTVVHAAQLELEVGYLTQIQELIAMIDAEEVSERVTRSILNILGLAQGALLLHDPRLERYVISFSSDPEFRETGEFLSGVPAPLLYRALASGAHYAFDEEQRLIIIPLQADQDLLGVVRVAVPPGVHPDAAAFQQVTRYVGSVVRVLHNVYLQTRSRELAMRDDLTKAFNRRFFETYLDEEIERSRRYGSVFSIIFLDLDDLKSVNNEHGHLAGSRTLQEVAKRVLSAVRGIDKVVRFGGDEFCVILPQTDCDQAVAVANRVRRALGAAPFQIDGVTVGVTASFGISTYPTHATSKEDLIRQADQAMYRVKATSKNAVGVAEVDSAAGSVR